MKLDTKRDFSVVKGSFTKQISYPSVAKSDEIGHKKRLFSG